MKKHTCEHCCTQFCYTNCFILSCYNSLDYQKYIFLCWGLGAILFSLINIQRRRNQSDSIKYNIPMCGISDLIIKFQEYYSVIYWDTGGSRYITTTDFDNCQNCKQFKFVTKWRISHGTILLWFRIKPIKLPPRN